MGYSVCKEGNKGGWYVLYEGGAVPKHRVKKPGSPFENCISLEQARGRAKELNKEDRLAQKIGATRRRRELDETSATLLPPDIVALFEQANPKLCISHWERAKCAIRELQLPPTKWRQHKASFYKWFLDHSYSLDYSNRIRNMLNRWLDFYDVETQRHFAPIPEMPEEWQNAIIERYTNWIGRRRKRPSGRLSFTLLAQNKDRFTDPEFRALFISIAFGLRPEEVNKSLRTVGRWTIEEGNLYVYQYKKERKKFKNPLSRWKEIPIRTAEQQRAIKLVLEQNFKLPRSKKMSGMVDNWDRPVTPYGGRKEYYPATRKMFPTEPVWKWMGHSSPETAATYYDDPFDSAPKNLIIRSK